MWLKALEIALRKLQKSIYTTLDCLTSWIDWIVNKLLLIYVLSITYTLFLFALL